MPMWQNDCETFRKVWLDFELRDVTTGEHEAFVKAFSEQHALQVERHGTTVRFLAKPKDLW